MAITFYTVDVGHGLCQVIRFSSGRAILIDGGGKIGKRIAEHFLGKYVTQIVAYVATHNDSDHVGAAPELLNAYGSKSTLQHIWLLLDRPAKKPAQRDKDVIPLLGYAQRREEAGTIAGMYTLYLEDIPGGTAPKVIHDEPAENAQLQLLYPKVKDVTNSFLRGTPDAEATNESCAILRLVVGGASSRASVLVTGDANCRGFTQARQVYGYDLSARVLSIPHHGGHIPRPPGAASWDEVVSWISPEIAVVSAGYGTVPPTTITQRAAFAPLQNCGTKICCTQITKHCHPNVDSLHPGVLPPSGRLYPQMSGHKDYAKAVGCYGTIAIKVDSAGKTSLVDFDRHQREADTKLAAGATPHCR